MTFDGKVLGEEVVAAAKGYVDKSLLPVLARLDAIDANWRSRSRCRTWRRSNKRHRRDLPGVSEMPDVEELITKAIADLPVPRMALMGATASTGLTA